MVAATANGLPGIDSIVDRLWLARTESSVLGEPTVPFTREKSMRLESGVTVQLQNAAATLETTRAAMWNLIDDPRPLPDEILQSAIRYWAAVRSLRIWLGAYRELRHATYPLISAGE